MIGLAILAAVTFSPAKLEPPIKRVSPRVTDAVAGLSVRPRKVAQVLWKDPAQKLFAFKIVDCDYSHVQVQLASIFDPTDRGFLKVSARRIYPYTKHGIPLGLPSANLQKKLGRPDYVHKIGRTEIWRYVAKEKREHGFGYLYNDYSLSKAKVCEITIGYERVPGCGDTNFNPAKDWYEDEM